MSEKVAEIEDNKTEYEVRREKFNKLPLSQQAQIIALGNLQYAPNEIDDLSESELDRVIQVEQLNYVVKVNRTVSIILAIQIGVIALGVIGYFVLMSR